MQRTRFATQSPYPGVHASISAKPILTVAPGTAPIDGPHKNSGRHHALARRLGGGAEHGILSGLRVLGQRMQRFGCALHEGKRGFTHDLDASATEPAAPIRGVGRHDIINAHNLLAESVRVWCFRPDGGKLRARSPPWYGGFS